jgi:PAS domain S-box-containing protein
MRAGRGTRDDARSDRDRTRELAEVQRIACLASWEWDIVADRVIWSPELFELFGVDPLEYEPSFERFLEQVHPDDRLSVEGAIVRACAGDAGPFRIVHRAVRPDGGERLLLCRAQVFRDAKGAATRMVGATLDLTDLQSLGDELSSRHQQMVAAEEVAGTGSWEWDVAADRISWSAGMYRIFGRARGELATTRAGFFQLVHPEDREDRAAKLDALLEEGESLATQLRIIRPDGAVRWLSMRSRLTRDRAGRPRRLIGVCRDITAERAD